MDLGLLVNILRAEINENGGRMIMVLEGDSERIKEGIQFLERSNVQVREMTEYVRRDQARCTDCGVCVSICPVHAYELDRSDYHVEFHAEKCIACGLCLDACPAAAISIGAKEDRTGNCI